MKRKLFIIRHGKSSWDSVVDDIDRPLNERGINNSYEMAHRLKSASLIPEVIFSSTANRALHTALIMARVWELAEERIHLRRELYLAELDDITQLITELPDTYSSIAIYGHNPAFTYFVNKYCSPQIENLPTTGVAVISFELSSWNDFYAAKAEDVIIDFPKK